MGVKRTAGKPLGGKALVDAIVKHAEDKKAEDIKVIDLRKASAPADWFIVCQGEHPVHNRAIADSIDEGLAEAGTKAWHVEGKEDGRWVVLDYSDVVVHVMMPDARKLYDLESLWDEGAAASSAASAPKDSPKARLKAKLKSTMKQRKWKIEE
jgi:ribosome-associated protein